MNGNAYKRKYFPHSIAIEVSKSSIVVTNIQSKHHPCYCFYRVLVVTENPSFDLWIAFNIFIVKIIDSTRNISIEFQNQKIS